MKILFMDWYSFGRNDLLDALKQCKHTVACFPADEILDTADYHTEYILRLKAEIERQKSDAVFSMNYFPSVSQACNDKGIPYISWVYDNPFSHIYGMSVVNNCNFIFTFDSGTCRDFLRKGVKTFYYAPLAANTERLEKIYLSRSEREAYKAEVSFVGAFYNEKDNFYKQLSDGLNQINSLKTIGFLDSIIEAQYKVYGANFLEHCLTEDILRDIQNIFPYQKTMFSYYTSIPYMYSSFTLSKRVTELERNRFLKALAERYPVKVYTPEESRNPGNCIMCGRVRSYDEAPKVYKESKINLNITLRSIETGIPLRAVEIMGAGGFLMTNYQEDFLKHFKPDREFVFYEDKEDLMEKTAYYLEHETERKKIAKNGFLKTAAEHTYKKRLEEMLAVVFPAKTY